MTCRTIKVSPARIRALWMDHSRSVQQAADTIPMSGRHFAELARRMGLPRRPVNRPPDAITNKAEFRLMWNAGLSTDDIAEACGCHRRTVLKQAHRMGLPSRHRGFKGRCTVEQYRATKLRLLLEQAARIEQAAIINAAMADKGRDNRLVGIRQARALL